MIMGVPLMVERNQKTISRIIDNRHDIICQHGKEQAIKRDTLVRVGDILTHVVQSQAMAFS